KILTDRNFLNQYHSVDEGIENRIIKYIIKSTSTDDLIMKVKTKRYTYHKLRRMFTHIMVGLTKEFVNNHPNISYIRVLGFSSLGRSYLNNIKKDLEVPLITNIKKHHDPILD